MRRNKSKVSGKGRSKAPAGFGAGRFSMFFAAAGIFCLSLLFVFGHDVITQGHLFSAKEILVLGNHRLSEAEVLALAGIEPGTNIFSVNLGSSRKRLIADGWVAEARIGREIPDRLVVRVREHEPVAVVDLGEKYILSREGTIIRRWKTADSGSLPLVTGLTYSDLPIAGDRPSEAFDALKRLFLVAEAGKGVLSLDRLEKIDVDSGLGITVHAAGPVKSARIGFTEYAKKFERVKRLLASLDRGPESPALEIISLESDDRIVAGPFKDRLG